MTDSTAEHFRNEIDTYTTELADTFGESPQFVDVTAVRNHLAGQGLTIDTTLVAIPYDQDALLEADLLRTSYEWTDPVIGYRIGDMQSKTEVGDGAANPLNSVRVHSSLTDTALIIDTFTNRAEMHGETQAAAVATWHTASLLARGAFAGLTETSCMALDEDTVVVGTTGGLPLEASTLLVERHSPPEIEPQVTWIRAAHAARVSAAVVEELLPDALYGMPLVHASSEWGTEPIAVPPKYVALSGNKESAVVHGSAIAGMGLDELIIRYPVVDELLRAGSTDKDTLRALHDFLRVQFEPEIYAEMVEARPSASGWGAILQAIRKRVNNDT